MLSICKKKQSCSQNKTPQGADKIHRGANLKKSHKWVGLMHVSVQCSNRYYVITLSQLIFSLIITSLLLIHYLTSQSAFSAYFQCYNSHWSLNIMIKVCKKRERNQAIIPGWIMDNFARSLTLWPWPLTSWPLQHFRCHATKLCTKFEHNQIIHGWDIDNLARFHAQF